MASTEVVELSGSDDDDFQESSRKPIGWNYQLGTSKTIKSKPRPNGTTPPPASHRPVKEEDDDDDIEIIEVDIGPKKKDLISSSRRGDKKPKKKNILPPSSSRSEIRKQVRSVTQSSISDFFNNKKDTPKDSKKKVNGKEIKTTKSKRKEDKKENEDTERENREEEEENDKSTASMEEFLRRWEEIKISKDDEKIRDKIWKHYHLAQTSYTHSKAFIRIIETSTSKLTVDNIYVVIKDILDYLKQHKDTPYREKESGAESAGTSREGTPAANEIEDTKVNSKLKKVEKKMKEMANKIKEMENEEVDMNDEDNSAYLVEDRLKRQFAKLHDYYCRLANCSSATGRPIERKFKYRGSRWMEINKRITAWVNKHKEFPDYVDILNLVRKVTKQSSLPLRPETVRVQAQEIFREVGKMLKDRRESDDLYSIYSYMEDEDEEDPATHDDTLNTRLIENEKIAAENLNKIFQEYVEKDGQKRELADINSKKSEETSEQKDSLVKDPSGTAECQEETSKTDGESKVKEDSKVESPASTSELQVTMVRVSDNCTENDGNSENGDTICDKEDDALTEDHGTSGSEDGDIEEDTSSKHETSDEEGDTSAEEMEEEERQDTKEQNACERGKEENELDDGDETDDDLKVVLASACIDEEEEEEDSEEDILVMDSEDFLKLDVSEGENSSKNSVLCLDDDTKEREGSDKSSVLCLDDDSQELSITSPTILNNNENLSTSELNTEKLAGKTTTVTASPDAPVDTSTTPSSRVTSKPQQKRQLEESLSPCKKLCISDGNS